MKHHTFRTRHLQAIYTLMGYKNNIECVNLSVEKPFHVRSQIHSSSLSVKNKITQCVSSALLLNTPPIKNLLSRVQEPPDPITRVQVGSGVEEHVPSPSLVSQVNKVFQLFPSSTQAILLFNETNNKVKIKPTVICQREISCFFICPTVDFH